MKRTLIMAVAILAGCNQSPVAPSARPGANPAKNAKTAADAPFVKLKDTAIWYEYERNLVAADAKYKGKVIELEGFVDKIGIDDGNYFVGLMAPEGYPPGVVCFVDPSKSKSFESLKPQSPVSIIGTVKGAERDSSAWQGFRIVLTQCKAK